MYFNGYNETQEAKQAALSDAAYAAGYGFAGCRAPTPGAVLPADKVDARLEHIREGWAYEANLRDKQTSGFDPKSALPITAQYHLAERMMPYPQTDRPWERSPLSVGP